MPQKAFFDVTLTCEDCQSDFRFTASEQKFWYEDLKFFEESRPKQCRRCRPIRRRTGALTAELGQALKALASKDPALLTRIADIYIELGDIEKASLYLRRAKNQTADPGGKAALIERLAELSREPDA
ncbi:MAG: zinc-ribbon domain containing protein [Vicinamibacterales bacterium]